MTEFLTKAKKFSLPTIYPKLGVVGTNNFMPFRKGIHSKCNANSHVLDLSFDHRFYFLRRLR